MGIATMLASVAWLLSSSPALAQDFISIGDDWDCTSTCSHDDLSDAITDMLDQGKNTICISNNQAIVPSGSALSFALPVDENARITGAGADCTGTLRSGTGILDLPVLDLDDNNFATLSGDSDLVLRRLWLDDLSEDGNPGAITLLGGAGLSMTDVWVDRVGGAGDAVEGTFIAADGGSTVSLLGYTTIRHSDNNSFGDSAIELTDGSRARFYDDASIAWLDYPAIDVEDSVLELFEGTTIYDVRTTQSGAINLHGNSTLNIEGSGDLVNISGNLTAEEEGAISIDGDATVTISGAEFNDNESFIGRIGGAIAVKSTATGTLRIEDSTFFANDQFTACNALLHRSLSIETKVWSTTFKDGDRVCLFGAQDVEFVDVNFWFGTRLAIEDAEVDLFNMDFLDAGSPAITVDDSDLSIEVRTSAVAGSPFCVPGPAFDDYCNLFDGGNGAIRSRGSTVYVNQTAFVDQTGPAAVLDFQETPSTDESFAVPSDADIENTVIRSNDGEGVLVNDSTVDLRLVTIYGNGAEPVEYNDSSGVIEASILQSNFLTGASTNSTLTLRCLRALPFTEVGGAVTSVGQTGVPVTFVNEPTDLRLDAMTAVGIDECTDLDTTGERPDIIGNDLVNLFDMGAYESSYDVCEVDADCPEEFECIQGECIPERND